MTDEELIISYKKSEDKHALGELYKRYAHLVLGLCLKMLKDEEKAKDMSMEIFQSLFQKLLKHDVEKFRPWLYTLARNECLMKLRGAKHKVDLPEENIKDDTQEELSLKLLAEKKLERMEEAIDSLRKEQGDCLRAFYLEKKCYEQVAEELGMELLAVKSHIQNGKRMLKNLLLKYPEFQ